MLYSIDKETTHTFFGKSDHGQEMIFCYQGPSEGHAGLPLALVSDWQAGEYIHDW